MKYIVTWVIIKIFAIPCPVAGPDEFGRESDNTNYNLCMSSTTTPHKNTYTDRKEAFSFYQRAKVQEQRFAQSNIDSVKIDSVKAF